MAQEIGAIEIGIGVDTSKLKSELNQVTTLVREKEREFRNSKFEIPVRLQAPSQRHIETIQRQIRTQLNYAQGLGLKLTPELAISNETGTKFINNLQQKLSAKEVLVPVGADVDGVLFRAQILKEVGVVNIPLTWHWTGKGPPSGGGGGGGGTGGGPGPSGGGPGVRRGFRTGPRPTGGAAAAPPTGRKGAWTAAQMKEWKEENTWDDYGSAVAAGMTPPYTEAEFRQIIAARTAKTQQAVNQGRQQEKAAAQQIAKTPGGKKAQQPTPPPVQAAPVTATASGAGATAGAVRTPAVSAGLFAGARKAPLAESQRPSHTPSTNWMTRQSADPTIDRLMERFKARDPEAIDDLLRLGGSVKNGGVSFKKNSVIGKAPEDQRDAIIQAFQTFQSHTGLVPDHDVASPTEGMRFTSGNTGSARKLAAPIGIDAETNELNNFLTKLLTGAVGPLGGKSLASRKKAQAYAGSEPVQAFKALAAQLGGGDEGFLSALLGPETGLIPNLGTSPQGIPTLLPSGYAQGREGDPAQALYPNLRDAMAHLESGETDTARVIARHHMASSFATDPQLAARLLSVRKMRETNAKTGEEVFPDPQDEATAAALQAIFGEAASAEQPRQLQREKEYRKQTHGTGAPPKAPASAIGTREKRSFRGTGAEELDDEGQKALRAESRRLDARVKRREHLQGLVQRIGKERAHPFGEINLLDTELGGGRNKFGQFNFPFSRRAEGGALRSTGLLGRLAARGITPQGLPAGFDLTKVGEHGEELIATDQSGKSEVIPHHQVPTWLARAQQGKGLGKDLTGHAEGGPLSIVNTGRGGQRFSAGGKFVTDIAARTGAVTRVFVVNWPGGGGFGAGAAGTARPTAATAGQAFTAQQAASFGQQAKATLGAASKGSKSKVVPDVPLTALEEAQLAARTQDLVTAERLKQKALAAQIAASIREAPTRGVQTATGEVTAINLGGLRGVIERRRLADEAQTRATAGLNLYSKAQEKLNTLVEKGSKQQDPKKIADYTKRINEQQDAVDFLSNRYEHLSKEANELGKNVISGSDKLRIFGANTAGVIAGTFLYSGALGAVQAGITGLTALFGPAIERMTGFQNVSAKVVGTLSDQAKQSGGAVKATLAQTEATAGLSVATANLLDNQLQSRVTTEAGNKALQEQFDLLHSGEAVSAQNQGLPGDQGLFRTTGGLFGTDIGGTPSTAEFLLKELGDLPGAAARNAPPPATRTGVIPKGGFTVEGPNLQQAKANPDLDDFTKNLQIGTARLNEFNQQAQKGGEVQVKLIEADQAQADASAELARQGGPAFKGIADLLQSKGLAFQGAGSAQDITRYLQALTTGAAKPAPELLIRQAQDRQIPNQLSAINAEEQLITRPTLAAQQRLDQISNPPLPFGTGLATAQNAGKGIGRFPGVDPAAQQSFNTYEAVATSALDKVAAKAKEGAAALDQLGVPPELITEMTTLGKAAQDIQVGLANRQAAVEAAEYNHELYILNRNLADAEALTGRRVGREGELGKLQRENFDISKKQQALQFQSQTLSLALSQKQINFQRALAGFQAPGETAEERAARIKEAKIEADYAQKQLNIQKALLGLGKRSFNVSVRLFDVQAERQVEDLKFAIRDLQAQHHLSLDTRAADQALAAIRKRQDQINSEIGIAIEKSTKKASLAIGQALDIANQTGEAFNKILKQTAQAWGTFVSQGSAAIQGLVSPTQDDTLGGTSSGQHAAGFLGNVSGATSMIVGEAGTETVAVLRNPRIKSLVTPEGGNRGGGGGTIVIDVHDNHISGDQDEERIVRKISRAVEQSINRKGALLNLRTV